MAIYDNIKLIATKRGVKSIAELERTVGLSNGSISKWNDYAPNVRNLKLVADELNVKVDVLLRDSLEVI
ncbi:XRE family transcriptional regulator [Weissella muntiaci]|uniref:XRE family transcriptional regulator n=1 Tax=Weissella muntiaci TaxID=2508881 RepID=A0A6C2C9C2_9LACO|nr:helix-turn-helix transcriptional regulator [Weissella muntiaci]TYC50023.1 XRE family transcriptional regulator [Weissella muntiaci]